MFIELLIGAVTFLLVWDYLYKKRSNEILKKSNITGPKAYPLLGSALELSKFDNESFFRMAAMNKQKYGKVYRVWVLHQLSVIVLDPKYLEVILSSQTLIKKSYMYDFLIDWLGTGLLLSHGKKWFTRRKIISPTFHFNILEQFVEVFDQQSGVMAQRLYEKADGKTAFDIFPIICLMALDIIAETAMGVKVHAQENTNIEYVKALAYVTRIMADRFIKPKQRVPWLFRLTSNDEYHEMNRCIKIMHNFTNNVIEERRKALQTELANGKSQGNQEKEKGAEAENQDVGLKKRMALLDVLLQSTVDGKPLSNEDIREEVDTFMFEGHDTTTSGISFCLYLISRHPEVQKKLVAEIDEVIGKDKNKPVTYRDLQELKYLECTIKESLRLFPSVPAIGREATEDFVMGDITIPAHTNVSLSLFMALKDEDYFPEPNAFKPERFSAENSHTIDPFAYAPFSAGRRNCIGQKFAVLEMKSTISKLLRHFELLPLGPEVRPLINLILRSVNGVHIGLKPRDATDEPLIA